MTLLTRITPIKLASLNVSGLSGLKWCRTAFTRSIVKGKSIFERCTVADRFSGHGSSEQVRHESFDVEPKPNDCPISIGAPDCHNVVPPRPKCEPVKPIVWPKCDRICIPCCKPHAPKTACTRTLTILNNRQGRKYIYPAYSERAKKIPNTPAYVADCCYYDECCKRADIGWLKDKLPIVEKQKEILGVLEKKPLLKPIPKKPCTRKFSTATNPLRSKENRCEGPLPCLKQSAIQKISSLASRKECAKRCTPCCAPARDPPTCSFPFIKPKCVRIKNPRPAFSECQEVLREVKPCDCPPPIAPCHGLVQYKPPGCKW